MQSSFFTTILHQTLQPEDDIIDIWCLPLEVDGTNLDSFNRILSEEERTKAARMRIEKPRNYFVAARGTLRLIISSYLKEAPERLEFQYGENGKPALSGNFSTTRIMFNMSHSHGLALYGVTLKREIGVDVEKVRQDMAITDIAKRFFSPREYEKLTSLPVEHQERGFFNCWTRKEAYLKATGQGLKFPLSDFDVSLTPGKPAALIAHRTDPKQVSRWSIVDLDVGPDYAAALAVEGKDFTLSYKCLPRNYTDDYRGCEFTK